MNKPVMKERAIAVMRASPRKSCWTIRELRLAANVAQHAQHNLARDLRNDPRVEQLHENIFRLVQKA